MISIDVNNTMVRRVQVDTTSCMNVMYHNIFMKLRLLKDQLRLVKTLLDGFTSDPKRTEGSITLPVELGTKPSMKQTTVEFVVIKLTCAHNIILG